MDQEQHHQANAERAERILAQLEGLYGNLQILDKTPITVVQPVVTTVRADPEPVYVNLLVEIDPSNPKLGLKQIADRLSVCKKPYQAIGLHPIRTEESGEHTLINHLKPPI